MRQTRAGNASSPRVGTHFAHVAAVMRLLHARSTFSTRRERTVTPIATVVTLSALSAVSCVSMSGDPDVGEKGQLIFETRSAEPVVEAPWRFAVRHFEKQAACPPAPGSNCRPTDDPLTVVSSRCDDEACVTAIQNDGAILVRAKRAGTLRLWVVAKRTDTGQTYEDMKTFQALKADRFELSYAPSRDVNGAFLAVGANTGFAVALFSGTRELSFDTPRIEDVFSVDRADVVEFVTPMRMNALAPGKVHVVARLGGFSQEFDVRAQDVSKMVDVELVEPRVALVANGGPCESAMWCPQAGAVDYAALTLPLSISSVTTGFVALGRDAEGVKYALPWNVVEVAGGALLEREYTPMTSAGSTVFHVSANDARGSLTVRVGSAPVFPFVR